MHTRCTVVHECSCKCMTESTLMVGSHTCTCLMFTCLLLYVVSFDVTVTEFYQTVTIIAVIKSFLSGQVSTKEDCITSQVIRYLLQYLGEGEGEGRRGRGKGKG